MTYIHHINHFFKTNSHLCNSRHEIWRRLALLKLRSLLNFLILGLKNNLVVDMILNLSLILSVLLFFTVFDNYPSMIYRCNHTDVILVQEKLMQINFSSYSIFGLEKPDKSIYMLIYFFSLSNLIHTPPLKILEIFKISALTLT